MTLYAHSVQNDVAQFHRAVGAPVGDTIELRRRRLRAKLILEEAFETARALLVEWEFFELVDELFGTTQESVEVSKWRAIDTPSLVETLDGCCDLLCVTYGTVVEAGVDIGPFWREVHRTNMLKQGGPERGDGKILKPAGWQPPDIAGILAGVEGGDSGR